MSRWVGLFWDPQAERHVRLSPLLSCHHRDCFCSPGLVTVSSLACWPAGLEGLLDRVLGGGSLPFGPDSPVLALGWGRVLPSLVIELRCPHSVPCPATPSAAPSAQVYGMRDLPWMILSAVSCFSRSRRCFPSGQFASPCTQAGKRPIALPWVHSPSWE